MCCALQGWITIAGNQGKAYLKPVTKHYICREASPVHSGLGAECGVLHVLMPGEAFMAFEDPKEVSGGAQFTIYRVRAVKDGAEGYVVNSTGEVRPWSCLAQVTEGNVGPCAWDAWSWRAKVLSPVPLTQALAANSTVDSIHIIRVLSPDELVDATEPAMEDSSTGQLRIRCIARKDLAIGWVTVMRFLCTCSLLRAKENQAHPVGHRNLKAKEKEIARKHSGPTVEAKFQQSHVKEDADSAMRWLNVALLRGAEEAVKKKMELEEQLADSAILQDQKAYAKKSTTLARFTTISDTLAELRRVAEEASDAKQMAAQYTPGDEMHELALEEANDANGGGNFSPPYPTDQDQEARELRTQQAEIASRLQTEMITPDDRDDATSVLVEVRPGVGGDEACLWAEDLVSMYQKYCTAEELRFKVISATKKEGGGYQEATLSVQGPGAWTKFKFESGVHRVQRVPTTEKAGRIHTSTATVAIMPEIDDTSSIDEEKILKEIKFQYCRSGGKGGQNVNKVETAVHATHEPTGIHFFVTQERSQLLNREIATKLVISKLKNIEAEAAAAEEAEMRSSQIGSGSRSEKSRSYNFKENRVTDHRLNQNFSLAVVLEGNLQEPVRLMALQEEKQKLEALERSFQKMPA
eukprot:s1584_g8.t1